MPHLIEEGSSILQYAYDTMIFPDHDIQQAMNMKLLLCTFEKLSDLKIIFHQRKIFYFGQTKNYEMQYSHLFACDWNLHLSLPRSMVYQCIIENLIKIGKSLKKGLKRGWQVGKEKCSI